MKKVILIVLTMLILAIPAFAAEENTATDQPIQQEQEPVVVATLDELQAAIDTAEEDDVIYLSTEIHIEGETLETDKKLTIVSGNAENNALLYLDDGAKISGFSFAGDNSALIVVNYATNNGVTISNCIFDYNGNDYLEFIRICGDLNINKVYIDHCTFSGATGRAITITAYTDVQIDSCNFERNHTNSAGGAISSSGKLQILNSTFTDNSSSAVNSPDDLLIKNCQFSENFIAHSGEKNDIFSTGKTTIINDLDDSHDYYNEITGEKIEMPLTDYEGTIQLIRLTEEQAAEYFVPDPGDTDNGEDASSEQPQPPQQPGDQTGDDDTTGGEQPPQESIQPSEGEGTGGDTNTPDTGDQNVPQQPAQPPQGDNEGDPTDTPSQPPQEPTQPPKDETTDNPADTTPNTPQPPQKPSDGGNGDYDDYTPPIDYRPSQRPTKPTEDNTPQEQPDIPATTKPQLACNGAVIDTSRTVVLLGYGDGLLHEDDPLTRAQLATIIYRLLDDDSIVKNSKTELAFADVASDAWYAPYVRVIQAAGIVNGVGNNRYDPNGRVTWSQILAILSRFVEQKEYTLQHIQYSGWAQEAIQTAVALNWIEDRADFTPDAVISRGELVQLVNSVLELYRA